MADDDDPKAGQISAEDRAAIKARARELGAKLDRYRDEREPKRKTSSGSVGSGNAFGQAMRMAVDPVVGVLVGLGVGITVDNAAGTKPVFLLIGLFLGGAAGMWNLVRSASRVKPGASAETHDRTSVPPRDDGK